MSEVVPFDFEGEQVRVIKIDGEPYWVVNDVCAVLGIGNPHMATGRIDEEYLSQTEVLDGRGIPRQTNIVNLAGLNALIFRSDKPTARRLQRWVFEEVLPAIYQTGRYEARPVSTMDVLQSMVDRLREQEAEQQRLIEVQRVQEIEQQRISEEQRVQSARLDAIEGNHDWYSALAYAKINDLPTSETYVNLLGRAAAEVGREWAIAPDKAQHGHYGTVNRFPVWVWDEAVRRRRAALIGPPA